jgi:Protein of unknown function (DUF1592)/Protein of unknown function (DUF1588)/Protein of unknown function (DUF1587)/Protein of unknown function (DUF1595)/Ca-dependent carbohydrate-binding module xylan-binding/Protein of unknown function (DUF1585)
VRVLAVAASVVLLAVALRSQQPADERALDRRLETFVQPFLAEWCAECHSGDEPDADLDLPKLFKRMPSTKRLGLLLDVRDVLKDREMPPEDEPAPSDQERQAMVTWIRKTIELRKRGLDAGRVTMRRLSRVEYRNTVRDLFGIDEDVTRDFPADDLGYGFDNNGDTLSLSVLHLEKYAAAARRIAELAIVAEDPSKPRTRAFEAEDYKVRGRAVKRGDYVAFSSRGTVEIPLDLPRTGDYVVRIRAYGLQAGDESARMAIEIDGKRKSIADVAAVRRKPGTYERTLRMPGGERRLGVSFINDYFDPAAKKGRRDRNLYVDLVEVIGPVDKRSATAAHKWIFASDPGDGPAMTRMRPILSEVMRRAWRRPVQRTEVTRIGRLVRGVVQDGESFASGVQLAVQAILVSPHFLFRVEPEGLSTDASKNELLGGHEIASRLSYFLWSSLPDERLRKLAGAGKLRDSEVLVAETRRMLRDDRASALASNFATQWLELRSLDELTPDPKRFPTYSPALRDAMRQETELFFLEVLRQDLGVHALLDSEFTYLNEELAKHYEIGGVKGRELRRVKLEDRRRGGLIGHASIQTITSNPTRTSPVKRGKWILENLLDDAPPPPEPGADSFKAGADIHITATLRAQLKLHRASKACSVCHNRMDALGLALENYDAIGRWRDSDHGTKIDASGELPGGRKLDGPIALKRELRRGNAFVRCLAKKLFIYGVGRQVRPADQVRIDGLAQSLGRRPTLTDMIVAIVKMDAFRSRLVSK